MVIVLKMIESWMMFFVYDFRPMHMQSMDDWHAIGIKKENDRWKKVDK